MKKRKLLSALVLMALFACAAAAQTTTLTGVIAAPQTTSPLKSGNLTFQLSQASVLTGTSILTTQTVFCSTDSSGNIRLLPDPQVQLSGSANYGSGSIAAGAWYIGFTYWTGSTESAVSPAIGLSLSNTGKINVAAPTRQPSTATGYSVYLGTSPSTLKKQSSVTGWGGTSITSYNSGGAAAPTGNNSVCTVRANDAQIPQTTYQVTGTTATGSTVPGLNFQTYLTSGTVNVSNGWPLAGLQPRFPQPIIANPSSQATQSVNSPLTINGFPLTSGSFILPATATPPTPQSGTGYVYEYPAGTLNLISDNINMSPFTFDKTCLAAAQVGANAGAKIATCMARVNALGGGIVDATGLVGAQTVSQDVWSGVTTAVVLQLGASTIAASQTQNMCMDCSVWGLGRGESIWNYTGSGTAWSFSASSTRAMMSDLQIRTSQAGSTVGIRITGGTENFFDNVLITAGSTSTGFATGIKVTGSIGALTTRAKFTNTDVDYYRTAGISIDHTQGVILQNMFFQAELDSTAPDAILLDSLADEIYIQTASSIYGRHGLMLRNTLESPTPDNAPAFIFADQLRVDTTSGGAGIYFDSTLADAGISFVCTDCWVEGAGRSNANTHVTTANGIQHNGGQNVRFIGCRIRVADKSGVEIADADVKNVSYDGCFITENNQAGDADGQGIYVTAAATQLRFTNNWFNNESGSGDMKYGVKVAAVASTGLVVTGNTFATLTTGAMSNANTAVSLVGLNSPQGVLVSSLTQDELLTRTRTNVFADTPVTVLATDSVLLCNAVGGAITYNLPAVATSPNKTYTMKKIDAAGGNACTLDGNASETIDGATTLATSTQWEAFTITNNGTAWYVVSKN